MKDGDAFSLLHMAFLHEHLGQQIKFSIQNVLNSEHYYLLYLDDANAIKNGQPKFPNDLEGKSRNFQVTYTHSY